MDSLIDRIRVGLEGGLYTNERAVSTSIVIPVLRSLGWDDSDPAQVMPEYANPRGRVDYALSARPNSPAVFLEVKRVGQSAEADKQLFEYAFHEGAQIAVLTDGRLWNFYLPGQHGSYQDRRVYQLDIVERETHEIALRFRRYLARDRIASGEALSDATSDYRASASRREAELTLPKSWSQLLAEPDGLLMELLRERTEALCGHKPSDDAIEAFLQTRPRDNVDLVRSSRMTRALDPTLASVISKSAPLQTVAPSAAPTLPTGNLWRLGDLRGSGRNGNDAFVAILSALFNKYPSKQETMAAAVRTRGRNNIARTVAEIYPNRPEIGIKNHRQLPGGWFVGTNESSGTKTLIVTKAATAVGLVMGQDIDFIL